jgi:hypothetical protein
MAGTHLYQFRHLVGASLIRSGQRVRNRQPEGRRPERERVANYSLLCALCFAQSDCREHPLVLGSMVKRGAGISPAGLNNSRCDSLIGCYGISEYPFIASNNFCERLSEIVVNNYDEERSEFSTIEIR